MQSTTREGEASATLSPGYDYTYPCPLYIGSGDALGGHRIQTLAGVSGICVPASQERVCAQLVVCFSVDRYMHCLNLNPVKAFLLCEAPHHQAQACRSNM